MKARRAVCAKKQPYLTPLGTRRPEMMLERNSGVSSLDSSQFLALRILISPVNTGRDMDDGVGGARECHHVGNAGEASSVWCDTARARQRLA